MNMIENWEMVFLQPDVPPATLDVRTLLLGREWHEASGNPLSEAQTPAVKRQTLFLMRDFSLSLHHRPDYLGALPHFKLSLVQRLGKVGWPE